jgi:AcrR family transcriptional regulator
MGEMVGLRGHRVQNPERMKARRREILVTAAQVFARAGYTDATLDDVAVQMGVSRGVIYYYFRKKEELLTELVTTASGEAGDRLEAIIARGDPPDVTLRAALRDLAAHMFDGIDRYATMVTVGGPAREQGWMVATQAVRHRYRTLIRGVIQAGIDSGVFEPRNPGLMTVAVLGTVLRTVDWFRPDGELPAEVVAEEMIELAMGSVLRRSAHC